MKIPLKFLFFLIPAICFGQKNSSLSEQLWSRVKFCYEMFEDNDEDGKPDFEKIDDSKNGYLKIFGSTPPCGCVCSSTVAAYKSKDGKYTFLQSQSESCTWSKKISSDKNLTSILPVDFGINSFMNTGFEYNTMAPLFFVNFDIPQVGTDTKVKLELVPIGLKPDNDGLICYEYRQNDESDNVRSLRIVQEIATNINDEKTLKYLIDGNFNKISENDGEIIEKAISNGDLGSIEELQVYLTELKVIFDIYQKLDYTELILGWDRETSKFYIKEKGKKAEKQSFKDFLINASYWSFVC
jgi:hypothetical protein